MRVDNPSLNLTQPVTQTPASDSPAKTRYSGNRGGTDQVQISDMAASLSADSSRIAQLAAAVQNGTYSVTPSQIANSMISEMTAAL